MQKYKDQRNNPTKIKPLSPQDQESAIDNFANADKPDKQQGHKIGQAWAGQFANYYEKMGSEEDAAIQMYYDYAAMNPKQRGWSMSPEKLATAVGYAAAHAKGLDGINATNYAGSVTQYILGNMSSGGSSPKTGGAGQTGNKNAGNMSAPDYQQGGNGGSSRVGTGGSSWDFINKIGEVKSSLGDVAQWARANKNTQIGSGKFGSDVREAASNAVDKNKKILQEERDKYKKKEEAKRLSNNVGSRVR